MTKEMDLLTKADYFVCPKCKGENVYHGTSLTICLSCKHKLTKQESKVACEKAIARWPSNTKKSHSKAHT
jgi:hypothetical protein